MPTIVGVKLPYAGKVLYFDPAGTSVAEGDHVIVSTERGQEFGEVVMGPREVDADAVPGELKPVLRIADDDDIAKMDGFAARLREEMDVFRRLVTKHKLDMKPIGVEHLFDDSKVVFYFVAEERVDFRELVRELASEFHARIDMRQIGVRDEARMVGGLGHCGEQLCCARFGSEFQPVSIRMAKEQDLPLNPLKISGLCGRLMCCLRYEYEAYKDYKQRAPKCGTLVETPTGEGKVVSLNTPKETVTVRLPDGERITVPLDGLDCSAGRGCPCKLKVEVIEEPEPMLPEPVMLSRPSSAEPKTEVAETGESRSRRSRRSRKRKLAGEGGAQPQAQQAEKPAKKQQGQPQQRQQPKQKSSQGGAETGAKPAGEGASSSSRRRRRRRPSSGGQGTAADKAE
ncbi:MAG: stage 0 sporulation family protein [Coriobacteriia bacterium]|nr:stage 0 sporulation family protein [Coriobacteriia bacterium]